jgi:hypothetical protein
MKTSGIIFRVTHCRSQEIEINQRGLGTTITSKPIHKPPNQKPDYKAIASQNIEFSRLIMNLGGNFRG